jgi:hypothetical protein
MVLKNRYTIEDIGGIKSSLRIFMHETKKSKRLADRLAAARFLKEVKRELDDFLRGQGWLIKGK